MTTANLCHLLQLASPMLPIGAYGYSQGLETAIDEGVVTDAPAAAAWIRDVFHLSLARFDLPILLRLYRDWDADPDSAIAWNALLLAGRDTAEMHAEARQTGYSLAGLLTRLAILTDADQAWLARAEPVSLPLAFALAARRWAIDEAAMLTAYAWSWAENQVAVAMKSVPIGQVAGQRILLDLAGLIPGALPAAMVLADEEIANLTPGLSILSARHESQYSRLYRS